jgi:hypothetical protein
VRGIIGRMMNIIIDFGDEKKIIMILEIVEI